VRRVQSNEVGLHAVFEAANTASKAETEVRHFTSFITVTLDQSAANAYYD